MSALRRNIIGSSSGMLALIVALVTGITSGQAYAIDIPPLGEMEQSIAEANPSLANQRSTLQAERNDLRLRTKAHNSACNEISEDDPKIGSCTQELQSLTQDVERHVAASKQFNAELTMAIKAASVSATLPQDTMVVDARHVPTGLPKFVEDNIPNTPAGNRVRKGFEAVMDHDWKVALAWFQDALNHDPGNAGIMRLVDLAEYTMKFRKDQRPSARTSKPVADTSASDKATISALDQQIENRMDADLAKEFDDYNRNYLPKHPELQKPDESPKTALDKQLDDQMDEDLAKAFDDFNRNYLPKHPELLKPEKSTEQNANWKVFFDDLFKLPTKRGAVSAVRG